MERYWVTHCEWHSNLKDASADDGRDVEVVLYADAQATVEALQQEVANLKACQCDGCAETLEENDVYCEKCWTRQQTALDERDRLALDLKKRIWLLHGSRMNHLLYGDDGRMNCNVCLREYAEATIERCYEWEIVDACALVTKAALTPAGGGHDGQ